MIFPSGFIFDAPSKNSFHACSSEEMLIKLTTAISSQDHHKVLKFLKLDDWSGNLPHHDHWSPFMAWIASHIVKAIWLISLVCCSAKMDSSSVIVKDWLWRWLECVAPWGSVASSGQRRPTLSIPSRLGYNGAPPQSLFYLNSRLSARDFDHYSELVKLPRNDPSLKHITWKAFLILEPLEQADVWDTPLISSNASWQALSQTNETPFFVNLVKG